MKILFHMKPSLIGLSKLIETIQNFDIDFLYVNSNSVQILIFLSLKQDLYLLHLLILS